MSDVTALVPIHRTRGNREWLQQTVNSLAGAKVLILENDGEVGEAFNEGLRAADTEWVLPFGADDLAHPDLLDRLLSFSYSADVIYPGFIYVSEDLEPLEEGGPDPFCGNRLQRANFIPGCSLIRRSKALEVGGFRELESLEDWDLWVRLYRAGARFKPAPGAKMFYRQHAASRNARTRTDPEYRERLSREIVGTPPATVPATFYSQATPATTYLRCTLPARYLPGAIHTDVATAIHPDYPVQFPEHQGAAIFQFPGDKVRALNMALMRQEGIRTLVEVDDNYLIHPGKDVLKRAGWSLEIGKEFSSRDGHRVITRDADGVLVTTRMLRDHYAEYNSNVFICPNTVDPSDWPEPAKPDDGIFRIVWAASLSHDVDIPLVSKALAWASEQKDVEVHVVGLNPKFHFPFGHLPWLEDLDAYRATFSYYDVGLAPIKRLPFALFRSDIKALEYAMGACAPVLSDVEPYEDWDDTRSLKAQDAKGFTKLIKHLVTHREEAAQLAQAAREYALAHRTTEKQIHLWREAIDTH